MDTFLNLQWLSNSSLNLLDFILVVSLKSILILLATILLMQLLRRAAASTRHLIWSMVLISIFLLPIFSLSLPTWHVPVKTDFSSRGKSMPKSNAASIFNQNQRPEDNSIAVAGQDFTEGSMLNLENNSYKASLRTEEKNMRLESYFLIKHWPILALLFWAIGVVCILTRQLIGRILVWKIAQQAEEITDHYWRQLSNDLIRRFQIKRPIKLLKSDRASMPMTWGILRPKILLPVAAEQWSSQQKRIVLLHEFAHVKRFDTLSQLLTQLTQALYWFNPLLWFANHQLKKEREHACDDYVLSNGAKASDYASLLLDIARSLHNVQLASLATVAMARPTQLEGRLLAILNPQLSRRALTRFVVLLIITTAISMVLPLAAMRTVSTNEYTTTKTKIIPEQEIANSDNFEENNQFENKSTLNLNTNTTIKPSSNKNLKPASPAKTANIENNSSAYKTRQTILTQDKDSFVIKSLSAALQDSILEVRLAAAKTLGKFKSSDAVQALLTALDDPNWQMREKVVEALGEIEDPRAVNPLSAALKDGSWNIRKNAAYALGEIDDPSAIEALKGCLKDENPEVRKTAVWALGEIDDYRAVKALIELLNDPDWEVREKTAWALGEIQDPSAVGALVTALKDDNRDVRKRAIWALGEIADHGAVTELIEALKDEDWEIRDKAAWALGEIGDPKALAPLSAALKDENQEVRRAAAKALGEIKWRD